MSYIYRIISICRVRRESELTCRGCIYYQSCECEDMISTLQEEAERMEANYERLRQDNFKRFPRISGKA